MLTKIRLHNITLMIEGQGFRQDLGNWVCKRKNWVCKMLTGYARNSIIFIFMSFAAQKNILFFTKSSPNVHFVEGALWRRYHSIPLMLILTQWQMIVHPLYPKPQICHHLLLFCHLLLSLMSLNYRGSNYRQIG